jgi:hypothetical protein
LMQQRQKSRWRWFWNRVERPTRDTD